MKQTRLHLSLKKKEKREKREAAIMAVLADVGLRRSVEEGPLPWYITCVHNFVELWREQKKSQLSAYKIILHKIILQLHL
jgi:hypothetical protein